MMVEGLSHITFVVSDLNRMTTFLTHIFDAQEIYSSHDKPFSIAREKFFLVNGLWIAIMEGEALPHKTYNHVAFKIQEKDFERYTERIQALGIEVQEGRNRVKGEGKSLYFYDYDNHLFELHTGTLEQRLATYRQNNST